MTSPAAPSRAARLRAWLGRIWVRLLVVNVFAVLVPVFGLEFARIYEKQLLYALERDMNDQAALVRAVVEEGFSRGTPVEDVSHRNVLARAAKDTRTRIRLLGPSGAVVADSHEDGAPEGPEPEPPRLFYRGSGAVSLSREELTSDPAAVHWPSVADRREVKAALGGTEAAQTRVAHRPKAVFLFSAVPLFADAGGAHTVKGVVYVTRSTSPVLLELYRIRSGLVKVLVVTLLFGVGTTLSLALSISKPLTALSRAASRIAAGERSVPVPVSGRGEIRELAESFRTMTEELDRRLVYISEFSADVAHEFKSPLTSIRGAAELLAEGAHEDPAARERFFRNILLDTERLDRLVTRLLVLSRIEASAEEMTLVDLRSVLDRIVRRATERGPVTLEWAATRSWVRGREADLQTAVQNLVENAQRYSPAEVPVVVDVRDAASGVAISVRDRGPGIPEARREKIFERFYTTDGDRGGTGLGLAIVDSVARAHGGRITALSEPGSPTEFRLWLPLPAS